MFLWIILAALAFGAIFDGLGAVRAIEALFITSWDLEPWQVLIMMLVSFIVMGMFLDDTAMLVIVAPLYVPLVSDARLRPRSGSACSTRSPARSPTSPRPSATTCS